MFWRIIVANSVVSSRTYSGHTAIDSYVVLKAANYNLVRTLEKCMFANLHTKKLKSNAQAYCILNKSVSLTSSIPLESKNSPCVAVTQQFMKKNQFLKFFSGLVEKSYLNCPGRNMFFSESRGHRSMKVLLFCIQISGSISGISS